MATIDTHFTVLIQSNLGELNDLTELVGVSPWRVQPRRGRLHAWWQWRASCSSENELEADQCLDAMAALVEKLATEAPKFLEEKRARISLQFSVRPGPDTHQNFTLPKSMLQHAVDLDANIAMVVV